MKDWYWTKKGRDRDELSFDVKNDLYRVINRLDIANVIIYGFGNVPHMAFMLKALWHCTVYDRKHISIVKWEWSWLPKVSADYYDGYWMSFVFLGVCLTWYY